MMVATVMVMLDVMDDSGVVIKLPELDIWLTNMKEFNFLAILEIRNGWVYPLSFLCLPSSK